jgi:hypothetical protein
MRNVRGYFITILLSRPTPDNISVQSKSVPHSKKLFQHIRGKTGIATQMQSTGHQEQGILKPCPTILELGLQEDDLKALPDLVLRGAISSGE